MSYRPQYVTENRPGEQDFIYSFASFNVPSFAGNLGAGLSRANIPLVLRPGRAVYAKRHQGLQHASGALREAAETPLGTTSRTKRIPRWKN